MQMLQEACLTELFALKLSYFAGCFPAVLLFFFNFGVQYLLSVVKREVKLLSLYVM